MNRYNVTAEVEAVTSTDDAFEAFADSLPDELTAPFHVSVHVSEYRDDAVALTMTLDSYGPGHAANQAVEILRAFGIRVSAVEAMTTREFDRRNGLA